MSAALAALVAAAGVLASMFWLLLALDGLAHRRRMRYLADLPGDPPATGWPSLAVVVAARDEADHVEAAVRSLLEADYPRLAVIAVDDRSRDRTGEILDRLADDDARLRVIHLTRLPAGWLGKNHALQEGLRATGAEWVLFTDGDVRFARGALRGAVRHAVDGALDHVAVLSDLDLRGIGERLFVAIFGPVFFWRAPPWRVQDPRSAAYVGVGAFNLVRGEALRALGGFERISLSVDDDLRLGQLLKWTGGRSDLLLGSDAVSVRWQVGLSGMIRGLEKNFFAGMEFQLGRTAAFVLLVPWLFGAPHAGLFAGPWWSRALCAAGVSSLVAMFLSMGSRSRVGWYYALGLPVSALLLDATLVRSAWATLRRGGVRWRDHLYPLDELRKHVRERGAWMRARWRETRARRRRTRPPLDARPGSGQNR